MFADPYVYGAQSLVRNSTTENGSVFANSARDLLLRISHSYGKRTRHTIRLQCDDLVASPFVSGQNVNQSMTISVTVDVPNGYDTATAKSNTEAFLATLTATSGANITKLVGGES